MVLLLVPLLVLSLARSLVLLERALSPATPPVLIPHQCRVLQQACRLEPQDSCEKCIARMNRAQNSMQRGALLQSCRAGDSIATWHGELARKPVQRCLQLWQGTRQWRLQHRSRGHRQARRMQGTCPEMPRLSSIAPCPVAHCPRLARHSASVGVHRSFTVIWIHMWRCCPLVAGVRGGVAMRVGCRWLSRPSY